LSPPLPSFLALVKAANPGSPGKMAVKQRKRTLYQWLIKLAVDHLCFSYWLQVRPPATPKALWGTCPGAISEK